MNKGKKDEEVKRLHIKPEVWRELCLRSGNECAFPGCHNTIIDINGRLVGQICHIEAASPGGQRFNPNMTNEERRSTHWGQTPMWLT